MPTPLLRAKLESVAEEVAGESRYVEVPPPPALRPYVQCFWASRNSDAPRTQLVLPDGCTDIIATDTIVHVAGPMTTAESVPLKPHAVVAGIRFRPGAASAALGVCAADLVDSNPTLGALWGRLGDQWTARATSVETARDRLVLLARSMADRLPSVAPPDRISVAAGRRFSQQPEFSITHMAAELGLSERQLRRRIHESVGYSPRTLARIMRFQRFLANRERNPGHDLADLAVSSGYADQPHLTRECRALTGLTPVGLMTR